MFRTAVLRSARSAACQTVRLSAIARPAASSFVTKSQFAPSQFQAVRCYSAAAGLQKDEVESRILDLLKNFDKVGCVLGLMDFANHFTGGRCIEGTIWTQSLTWPLHWLLVAHTNIALLEWSWFGQLGYCWGRDGDWGGQSRSRGWYIEVLTLPQEFSIEIPDKEADAIHSGKFNCESYLRKQLLTITQLIRPLTTSLPSQMVSPESSRLTKNSNLNPP